MARKTSLGHTEEVWRDALGARTATLLDGVHSFWHASDPLGREVSRLLPNGGRIETGFDPLGRVSRRRTLDRISLGPAPAGQPDWVSPIRGAARTDTSYKYGAAGLLGEVERPDGGRVRFAVSVHGVGPCAPCRTLSDRNGGRAKKVLSIRAVLGHSVVRDARLAGRADR